jgi:hypothetical protein
LVAQTEHRAQLEAERGAGERAPDPAISAPAEGTVTGRTVMPAVGAEDELAGDKRPGAGERHQLLPAAAGDSTAAAPEARIAPSIPS